MTTFTRIGVFSGKGGVGKTTITANLCITLSENKYTIIAGDTDVDAPNLSILFQNVNSDQKTETIKVKTTEKSTIHPDNCAHCKRCIDEKFCNFDALSWDSENSIPVVDIIACEGCRACRFLCPMEAFTISAVESGEITTLTSPYGFDVVTGETILGAQTSGKLVTELKKFTEKLAKEKDCDLVIYDGPPGIGCPVIAAVADLDYIIVVMEPTKASLHDAERFIEMIEKFNRKFGVILNKADIWEEGATSIREYLKEHEIGLLGEIPLDAEWTFSVANRQPFVKYRPDSPTTKKFYEISSNIEEEIKKIK